MLLPTLATVAADPGTLGGSKLASWTTFNGLVLGLALIIGVLAVVGRPSTRPWPVLQPLSRVPNGLQRVTGVPGWAAVAVGLALYGLLVAGQGFYSDVAWHIALGRDDELMTAPHAGILLGLVLILGGAVLGTVVATFEGVEGLRIGALRVPRSLVPLWALGLGAVSGFPLDEVWHGAYGVDVTMWSPTHMLMILGATFTGLAAWLILAESGVRPTDGPRARIAHLLCAWLTIQGLLAPLGEFTFGVPQFNLLFSPIIISLAAGLALVAVRLVHGRGWTLGLVLVNFLLQTIGFTSTGEDPVDTRFGATFLASAVVVELVALVLGTDRRLRFGVACGVGIATVGLAGEYPWNADAVQPWTTALFPEALGFALVAAVGAGVLGTAVGRAIRREGVGGLPRPVLVLAAIACVAVIVLPLRRPTGAVTAALDIEAAGPGLAHVTADLTPAGAADDAYWFQVSAWQGGGLEVVELERTGTPGQWRTVAPVPVDGHWKTLLRLHRGAEMMAVPIFLPADPTIDEPEIPAVDRTQAFETERDYLLRETHDGNTWLSPLVHAFLVAMAGLWAAAFVLAVAAPPNDGGRPPRARPKRSPAQAATAS
ncbi:MAG: hypothetical protein M3Z03_05020 [Actinomycetota bacterium]|nr:hypothetical protein [Actinomycetota bacterium]